jgi:cytochrome c553
VEQLQAELAAARVTFATKAAAALEKRITDVAAFNQGGCRTCHEAEARAFLAKLKLIAGENGT